MQQERRFAMNSFEQFERHRSLFFAIAYRMLGSVADAEDMVQETFLRWQQVSQARVTSPKNYLVSIVTRLCIDRLRSARVQREQYIGTWLPEPIVTAATSDPAAGVELADSLSTAFLVLLESLSPTERAVFLLREVFEYEYAEIGQIVNKPPANCRQIFRRARQHLANRRSHFDVTPHQQEQITEKFIQAWNRGDLQGLLTLLAEDMTLYSDGGGKVTAAVKPLQKAAKVARFLIAIRRSKKALAFVSQLSEINHQPGIINYVNGSPHSILTFEIVDGLIQSIYIVVNPEKLRRVSE